MVTRALLSAQGVEECHLSSSRRRLLVLSNSCPFICVMLKRFIKINYPKCTSILLILLSHFSHRIKQLLINPRIFHWLKPLTCFIDSLVKSRSPQPLSVVYTCITRSGSRTSREESETLTLRIPTTPRCSIECAQC